MARLRLVVKRKMQRGLNSLGVDPRFYDPERDGVTQGLLGATIADVAPDHLRGTAFGIYDFAIGVAAFISSAGAGALWMAGGPSIVFGVSASVTVLAGLMLVLWPLPRTVPTAS